MEQCKRMFIDGQWVLSENGKTTSVINPADGQIIANVTKGSRNDVKLAIAAAKRAFYENGWGESSAYDRAALLNKFADEMEARADELARVETLNNGKSIKESEFDVYDSIACVRYYAGMCTKPSGQTFHVMNSDVQSLTLREPIGVVAMVVAWNFPISLAIWKLAPALAAGNTVVLKPASFTPLTAILLFEMLEKAGFPKGVVNLVLGSGNEVGSELSENFDVDKIAFTGSIEAGRDVMKAASGNMKGICLELGGKSPVIVYEDADFKTAVDYAAFGIFYNQGEVCSAGSRVLVHDSIYDRFVDALLEIVKKIKLGNGLDRDTSMGPLVTESHMNNVLEYIDIGVNEGAKLLCGGKRAIEGDLSKGYFVEPTIFGDCTPEMRIVKEEIFGPVLVLQKFSSEAEAIKLANDTVYGLAGGVFTQDISKGMRTIKKLRAGITWLNEFGPVYCEAPWGGYKQSGIGRELGTYGLDEFTEIKQVNIRLTPEPTGWFG